MYFWNYVMPHRLLINKSLRKEIDELRTQIDAYQIEYDKRVKDYQIKIEKVERKKEESLNHFKKSLIEELQIEQKYLESVAEDITTYVDICLKRNCLYQIRNIKRQQIKILQENNNYLSEQMNLIGEEIEFLRERQNELTSFTKVNDIIQLSFESGIELNFDASDDAKALLNKVLLAINQCEDSQNVEKFALARLKEIIQERSEYLPAIKYINWVIQQKVQFSKQLSEKRNESRKNQIIIRQEIKDLEENINAISISKEELAKKVRYFWARPITYLSAGISCAYEEKKEAGRQIKNVGDELHSMAIRHSDNQYKWESLQSEREDLSKAIESLKHEIDAKKEERKQWFETRDCIFLLCKKFEAPLIPEKKSDPDEKHIIETRLSELAKIKEEGIAEAERIYEQEKVEMISAYRQSCVEIESKIKKEEKQLNKILQECDAASMRVELARKKLEEIKNSDNRFFLKKLLSKTPDRVDALRLLFSEENVLHELQKKKRTAERAVNSAKNEMHTLREVHERNLRWCRPKYLRPTDAEAREEKALLFRKENIEKRHKEKEYESEN